MLAVTVALALALELVPAAAPMLIWTVFTGDDVQRQSVPSEP